MISYNGRLSAVGGRLTEEGSSLGALSRVLSAAEKAGNPLEDYGPEVRRFVEATGRADDLIISTAAYHGTLAGATKNALKFTQYHAGDVTEERYGRRLDRLVVEMAGGLGVARGSQGRAGEALGVAV